MPDLDPQETTDPRAVEALSACPVCLSGSIRFLLSGKSRYTTHRFRYDSCDDCGAVFINPRIPADRQTAELGGRKHSYLKYLPTREFDIAEADLNLVRPALRILGGSPGRPIRWLDVGCGIGNLLTAAHRRGAECYGLDADPSLIGWIREQAPEIRAETAELHNLPFDPPFDLVSADNVLEHINDGRAFLRSVHDILAEDGLLVLRVPNHRSLPGLLLRWSGRLGDSYLIDPDAHPINYWRRPLHRLLAEMGFAPVRTMEHLMASHGFRRILRRLPAGRWEGLIQGSAPLIPLLRLFDRAIPRGGLNVTVFATKTGSAVQTPNQGALQKPPAADA